MKSSFVEGEPYWVDVTTPDVPRSTRLYGELFGWSANDLGPEAGHYTMVSHQGKEIGAVGPVPPGGAPWWNVYFKVADAHRTARAVTAAGGTLLGPVMDVFDSSTIAACQAPDGAIFGISQPKEHHGSQIWDVAEAPSAVTLLAASSSAFDFYAAVFGWTMDGSAAGGLITAPGGGEPFGNMHVYGEGSPEGVRPSWLVVFKTADVDAFAEAAKRAGCTVPVGPMDLPGVGRNAFVLDPFGAGFTIVAG